MSREHGDLADCGKHPYPRMDPIYTCSECGLSGPEANALRADLASHCAHLRAVSGALVDAGMAVDGEASLAGAVRELAREKQAAEARVRELENLLREAVPRLDCNAAGSLTLENLIDAALGAKEGE